MASGHTKPYLVFNEKEKEPYNHTKMPSEIFLTTNKFNRRIE